MAKECSFDVISKVDMQEVKNAINQTNKEISQRYDFRNIKTEVELEEDIIKILTDSEFQLKSVIDILQSKLIHRKVAVKKFGIWQNRKCEQRYGATGHQYQAGY